MPILIILWTVLHADPRVPCMVSHIVSHCTVFPSHLTQNMQKLQLQLFLVPSVYLQVTLQTHVYANASFLYRLRQRTPFIMHHFEASNTPISWHMPSYLHNAHRITPSVHRYLLISPHNLAHHFTQEKYQRYITCFPKVFYVNVTRI